MPFTPSHALAVLPLATGRPGRLLVPAALVIGSWIPDLPYFVPPHRGSAWTHAASGPFTVDLVLGLAAFTLWELGMRRPLTDLAPGFLRGRLPIATALSPRRWIAAAVSVVLGALTHVVWDTFTHHDRWGTIHVAALTSSVGPLPLYKWFQFGSGVLGLAGLALWLVLWTRRTPLALVAGRVKPRVRHTSWALLLAVFLVAGMLAGVSRLSAGRTVEPTAVGMATSSIGAAGAVLVVICGAWQLSVRRLGHPGGVSEGPAQRRER